MILRHCVMIEFWKREFNCVETENPQTELEFAVEILSLFRQNRDLRIFSPK